MTYSLPMATKASDAPAMKRSATFCTPRTVPSEPPSDIKMIGTYR